MTTEMPHPIYHAELWDKIILAGVASPGVVRLSGHKRVTGWDIKEASGQDGASSARKGDPLGSFTATFALVCDPTLPAEQDDFERWCAFQDLIESSVSGPQPIALDIYHPDLARNRFKAVVKKSIGELVFDGRGGATVAVEFSEYAPPKKKKAAGASGSKSSKKSGASDPNDPIAKATEELNGLLNEGTQAPARKSGAF
jgi:hypothetical protein